MLREKRESDRERESGERTKSSERRRKHASLAGTHVETSSAAGLAGALSGVRSGLSEGGDERPAVSRFDSGRVCAALSRPKARPPKPRGAYFTNDRPPRLDPSLCLSAHAHVRPDTRPRSRPLRAATRCGRKRDETREAYLSATSSAGPAGEMKLDHLYWVVEAEEIRL